MSITVDSPAADIVAAATEMYCEDFGDAKETQIDNKLKWTDADFSYGDDAVWVKAWVRVPFEEED